MPRVRSVACAATLLLVAVSSAPAASQTPDSEFIAKGGEDNIQIIERAGPRVHVLRLPRTVFTGVVGNVSVIEQEDGLVLVDSGNSYGAGKRIVGRVKELSPKPVKAVIITHWHNDHPLGLAAIVEAWPEADVIATAQTKADMEAGRMGPIPRSRTAEYDELRKQLIRDGLASIKGFAKDESFTAEDRREWERAAVAAEARIADAPGTYAVLPRTSFTDRFVIEDEVAPVEALFLGRANTAGDAVAWLPKQRILIAGDAVVEPVPYMFNMYPNDMIAVMERMKDMDFEVLVPGHGRMLRGEAYLDKLIALIREVQAEIAPSAQAGMTLEEATAAADFTRLKKDFAGDSSWLAYFFDSYALTPLIESVYREAKGEPLGPPPVTP